MLSIENLDLVDNFGGPKVFGKLRSTSRCVHQKCSRFGKQFLLDYIRGTVQSLSSESSYWSTGTRIEQQNASSEKRNDIICWDEMNMNEIEYRLKQYLLRLYEDNLHQLHQIRNAILEADQSSALAR